LLPGQRERGSFFFYFFFTAERAREMGRRRQQGVGGEVESTAGLGTGSGDGVVSRWLLLCSFHEHGLVLWSPASIGGEESMGSRWRGIDREMRRCRRRRQRRWMGTGWARQVGSTSNVEI
jgi:hypothetical protein